MRFLIAILFCWSCLAASITTKTVKESGGDYTTLSAWEAGRQADLTASDSIELASIEGSWTAADTSAVTINGWTTDATRYICITNSTSKHDGKRYGSAASAYRLDVNNNNAMLILEDYVRVYGLQIKVSNITSDYNCIYIFGVGASCNIRIGYTIFTASSSSNSSGPRGVLVYDSDAIVNVFNCIGHGLTSLNNSDGAFVEVTCASFNAYNCTAFGNYIDFWYQSGTCSSSNCISQNAILTSGAWIGTWSGDYNVCSDGDDPPGSNPADQTVNVVFVNEGAGTEDLHLGSSDTSGVKDATSDQSSGLFSDDIDYVTRSGSWDIGADEYVAAATSAGQIIIIRQQ